MQGNLAIPFRHPILTRRSRTAASVDCADPVENQTFFTKSKILEKVVKQVQGDGELATLYTKLHTYQDNQNVGQENS